MGHRAQVQALRRLSQTMRITVDVWRCDACGYELEEVNALETIRGPMLEAFSDPPALAAILAKQRRERLAAAIAKHKQDCTGTPA